MPRRAAMRRRRAASMVEFALVGPPFIYCLAFIVELGYNFYAQEMLDFGMQNAARHIEIGDAQSITTAAQFESDCLCPLLSSFMRCPSNVAVNIVKVTDYYSSAPAGVPTTNGKLDTSKFTYTSGSPYNLMLATAVYTSPSISAWIPGAGAMAISTGSAFVHATFSASAFINENYPTATGPSCCLSITNNSSC